MSKPEYEMWHGYELEYGYYTWDIEGDTLRFLEACESIVDRNYSIRQAADNYLFSKSTLHKKIHNELPKISYELFSEVMYKFCERRNV